jgi:predicted PurR-regulated permease PerM
VFEIGKDVDVVVARFVRGQLVVMSLLAVAYSIGYSAVGVPLAIPIGILAGLVSFVPHVGGAIALLTALLACVVTGPTWLQILLVVVVHSSIQGLEGFVITPRIMSGSVGLPAVWVILALIVFGEVFGLLGVIIAVPAAAVIKTLVARAIALYQESAAYHGEPPPALRAIAEVEPPADAAVDEVGDDG